MKKNKKILIHYNDQNLSFAKELQKEFHVETENIKVEIQNIKNSNNVKKTNNINILNYDDYIVILNSNNDHFIEFYKNINYKRIIAIRFDISVKLVIDKIVYINFLNKQDYSLFLYKLISIINKNIYEGEYFKKNILKIYEMLGFSVSSENQNLFIYNIKRLIGGYPLEAYLIIYFSENREQISKFLKNNIKPQYKVIIVYIEDKKDFDLNVENIHYISYSELIESVLDFKEYSLKNINDYKDIMLNNWNNNDNYIRPSALIQKQDENFYTEEPVKLIGYFIKWLKNNSSKILFLTGDLGVGKTTFCQFICSHLSEIYLIDRFAHSFPIYISLKSHEDQSSLEQILYYHFIRYSRNINIDNIFDILKQQKTIVFFDGLDEMQSRISISETKKQLDELKRIINYADKIIIAYRKHFFQNDNEMFGIFDSSNVVIVNMNNFDDNQIEEYIQRMRADKWKENLNRIKKMYGLNDLMSRPLLLEMIVKILPNLSNEITAIILYNTFVNEWIKRERLEKLNLTIESDKTKLLMCDIAWFLWSNDRKNIDINTNELSQRIKDVLKNNEYKQELSIDEENVILRHIINATFLKRDKDGKFSFMHDSFLYYFLANKIYNVFTSKKTADIITILSTKKYDRKILLFLFEIYDNSEEEIFDITFLKDVLTKDKKISLVNYNKSQVFTNALQMIYWYSRYICKMIEKITDRDELYERINKYIPEVSFYKINFNDIFLENVFLKNIEFTDVDLSKANIRNAKLENVKFLQSNLSEIQAKNITALKTLFQEVNLKDADFKKSKFENCKFIGIDNYSNETFKNLDKNSDKVVIENIKYPVIQQLGHCERVITNLKLDSNYIASGGQDGLVIIYNTNLRMIWILECHTGTVNTLSFFSNKNIIASGSDDKNICLWDINKGKLIQKLQAHNDPITSIAFSPNGQILGSSDLHSLKLWRYNNDDSSYVECESIDYDNFLIRQIYFSSDNNQIIGLDLEENYHVWKIENLTNHIFFDHKPDIDFKIQESDLRIEHLEGHRKRINSLCFSPDGSQIASANMDKSIRVWNLTKQGGLEHYFKLHKDQVTSICYSSNSNNLISCSRDKTIKIWDLNKGKIKKELTDHTNWINFVCFDTINNVLASCDNDGKIILWDGDNDYKVLKEINGSNNWIYALSFSSDGNYLASAGKDSILKIWDMKSYNIKCQFEDHNSSITSLAFINKNEIASADKNGNINIFDIEKENIVKKYSDHLFEINSIDYLPALNMLISGGRDNTIHLYNLKDAHNDKSIKTFYGNVNAVKFAKNGKFTVTGGDAGKLSFWDIEKGKQFMTKCCFGNNDWLTLLPDGRFKTNGNGITHLTYTEQDTLKIIRASEVKEEYESQEAINNIFSNYYNIM